MGAGDHLAKWRATDSFQLFRGTDASFEIRRLFVSWHSLEELVALQFDNDHNQHL